MTTQTRKKPSLYGLGEARHYPELPARVIDAAGRKGQFKGNRVRLDTGEIVDADGFMVVWPGGHARIWLQSGGPQCLS